MATPPPAQPAAPPACPVCYTPRAAGDTLCAGCGLVFASRGPEPAAPALTLAGGRYLVQRVLSHGGMGTISLAVDREVFGRPVVIKAMLDYFDPADPQAAAAAGERFRSEARTLAGLRHPAIPQIYSYFAEAGRHYIVMEYIAGRDLDAGLSRADEHGAPLVLGAAHPTAQVLRWGVALCKVLEYLATRRPHPVVHHDIKPANLILDAESGELRLVDFGTARARLLAQAGRLGGSGLFGTHGYAPPEQYRGESEPRSDVYALAATLYHLASDDDPAAHPFSFPRLPELGELGLALAPALDREVARRPSAAELRAALEALLAAPAARPLLAPDGSALSGLPALAAWARHNWAAALGWLSADLAEQIAVRRGETSLAARVVALRDEAPSPHLALDAALALLDPDGYGAAAPAVELGAAAVDFGRLSAGQQPGRALRVRNPGRRCLVARLAPPDWVAIELDPPDLLQRLGPAGGKPGYRLILPPGQDVELALRVEVHRMSLGGRQRGRLRLTVEGGGKRHTVALAARVPLLGPFTTGFLLALLLGLGGPAAPTLVDTLIALSVISL